MLNLRLSMLEDHASGTFSGDVKVQMRAEILKTSYTPSSNLKVDHVLAFLQPRKNR